MKTILDIDKISRKKFINEKDFFELNEEKRNYYIGWSEGLCFIKNSINEDESSTKCHINFMIDCLLKKINREKNSGVNDFSFGWLEGYLESLKWFLE